MMPLLISRLSRVFVFVLLIVPLGLLPTATAKAAECTTLLPEKIDLEEPDSSVPADVSRFLGYWGSGKWGGKLCHVLIVTKVGADGSAQGIYSWGDYAEWNTLAGFLNFSGRIEGSKLDLVRFSNGAEVNYTWKDGKLRGEYRLKKNRSVVELVPVNESVVGRQSTVPAVGQVSADKSIVVGRWVWQSGLGPAILSVENIDANDNVSGSYTLTDHSQHKSVFFSGDGSEAILKGGHLKIKLKSGSSFLLALQEKKLVGEFTSSRSGSVNKVIFSKKSP